MRLTLREAAPNATFWWITKGRERIGRVYKMGDGTGYGAVVGSERYGPYPDKHVAFDEAGARYMGYASAAALRQHNAAARHAKATVRRVADHAIQQVERGNFKPFDTMLSAPRGVGVRPLVDAFARSLGMGSTGKRRRRHR